MKEFSKDSTVLDCFSYSGGFGINALVNNAKKVDFADSSKDAVILIGKNLELNNININKTNINNNDVFNILANPETKNYDVIILDPPPFAKSQFEIKDALKGYDRLHHLALNKLNPQGILITFSCSFYITSDLLLNNLSYQALKLNKNIKVLKYLQAGIDHPYLPDGKCSYLKGFIVQVF